MRLSEKIKQELYPKQKAFLVIYHKIGKCFLFASHKCDGLLFALNNKMIDLKTALNCINVQRQHGIYRGARIGQVVRDCPGLVGYVAGQIVLFTEELTPSDSQMQMGEYRGMEQKPTGRVTVESPLSAEEIAKQRANGSLLTTIGTTIGVPRGYIEEIVLE